MTTSVGVRPATEGLGSRCPRIGQIEATKRPAWVIAVRPDLLGATAGASTNRSDRTYRVEGGTLLTMKARGERAGREGLRSRLEVGRVAAGGETLLMIASALGEGLCSWCGAARAQLGEGGTLLALGRDFAHGDVRALFVRFDR